ncbi:MAG: succinate dehydrogenase cytochrome b subunit [Myxococcota bacterium]|jgi:succinate dehydrogenase / fumarate reductase cytochrome b subunit|nr:succinate dehydrogenase [Deltaproteobacteria bacterium]MCP4243085.1 succinate dehydrogenase cytochrome b subunit [bacterium]MDP6076511.1 succinate dehydrogenase cytochrome b subunit [Myxococcota bacterium]MDP6242199.1 succinate dehydrogenase cytochrome b subunit [Myxococcota bacterium]MDP7075691.1 succinate dehydrogenase cytochrome b subunit [Myxococcota bacterium]
MTRILLLYRSVVGKKTIVAVTGAMLLVFLILHVIGNLKAFLPDPSPGVSDIDVYSRFLRTMGEPLLPYESALWIVRVVMGTALVLHIVCVLQLASISRRARDVSYERVRHVESTAPARWMLYTGTLMLFFLVVHLLQFTTGSIDTSRFVEGAVYANLYRAFQQWYFAVFYLVAMGVLAIHLYHGVWSVFQSLGIDNPDRNSGLRRLGTLVAVLLTLAFAALPAAFWSGVMPPPSESAHFAQLTGPD